MRFSALLLTLALASHAFGSSGTVSLSPAVVMLRGEAGQSTTQTFVVRNDTSRSLTFTPEAEDVVVRNGVRSFEAAGVNPAGIAATAVFSERSVAVAPGESAAVTVTVTIPPDTGHRAVLALLRGSDRIMNGSVAASFSLGALLTFSLSDEIAMNAEPLIVQPQTATRNLSVTQTCTNSGREPFVARGAIAVIDSRGQLAGKAAFAPHRLLPGERAELGAEYTAELEPGRYRVLVSYDYDGHSLTQSAELEVK